MDKPTKISKSKISDTETMTEIRKDFGDRIGFSVRGIYDEKGFFHLEHYYPYLIGREQAITVETTDGSASEAVMIMQFGRREVFEPKDGDSVLKDNGTFNVLKV